MIWMTSYDRGVLSSHVIEIRIISKALNLNPVLKILLVRSLACEVEHTLRIICCHNSWESAVKMDFTAEAHTAVQFGIARKLAQQQMSSSNSLVKTSNYGELKQIISPDELAMVMCLGFTCDQYRKYYPCMGILLMSSLEKLAWKWNFSAGAHTACKLGIA